jgi:hypothetical protein
VLREVRYATSLFLVMLHMKRGEEEGEGMGAGGGMYRCKEAMLREEIVLVCETPFGGLRAGGYARVTPLRLQKVFGKC